MAVGDYGFEIRKVKQMENDELLTIDEAAEILTIKAHTLNEWRRLKKGPPYVKIGVSVRYKKSDISNWIEERTVKAKA